MKAFFVTPLVIFLLFMLLFMAKMLDTDRKVESALIGKPIPEFELPAVLEGDGLKTGDIKGRYALVNVFASWCIPCKIEHAYLLEVQKEGKLPVYGINWKDDSDKVKKWFKEKGNPYTKIGADKEGKVVVRLGVTGAPETFLISPEGVILYRYAGVLTNDVFENEILPKIDNN